MDRFDFYFIFICVFYGFVKIFVFYFELFYLIFKNILRKSVFKYEKYIKF